MDKTNRAISRKNFVVWSAGVISALTAATYFLRSSRPRKKTKTVRMLSQEGQLVEVEISKLPPTRKKIRDADIHKWVKSKPTL